MIGYPTNRLLMVFDDPDRAVAAAASLGSVGIDPLDVDVLSGDAGVEALRRLGGASGLPARFVRVFQFLSMDQMPDFVMYEAALREGRAVVAVRPRDRVGVLAARDRLAGEGGHFANWFGRLSTEELTPWVGPEPAIPDYLRR
jgi:hypothetical protein